MRADMYNLPPLTPTQVWDNRDILGQIMSDAAERKENG